METELSQKKGKWVLVDSDCVCRGGTGILGKGPAFLDASVAWVLLEEGWKNPRPLWCPGSWGTAGMTVVDLLFVHQLMCPAWQGPALSWEGLSHSQPLVAGELL